MTSYVLRLQEENGTRFFGHFRTRRSFEAGDLVNLPASPDVELLPETKGHIYRVVDVEHGNTLLVEYVTPWDEGLPECADTFRHRDDGRALDEVGEARMKDPARATSQVENGQREEPRRASGLSRWTPM